MGKSAGSAPQAPDPKVTIPLQTAANKDVMQYALDQSRVNQVGPYGSQYWTKSPTFDQSGYDKALQDWQKGNTGGYWSQTPNADYGSYGADDPRRAENPAAVWIPGTSTGGSVPTKDQFTTQNWTYHQELSPEQQQLYDANVKSQLGQAGLLDRATQTLQNRGQFSTDGLPELRGDLGVTATNNPQVRDQSQGLASALQGYQNKIGGMDSKQYASDAADAMYRQSTRYLDPQVQQQQQSLEARLAEQGFVPGTPMYDQQMQNFRDTNARTYADARDRAISQGVTTGGQWFNQGLQAATSGAGMAKDAAGFGLTNDQARANEAGQIADRLFGQQQASATFNNQARGQGLAEALQLYNQPMADLNALRSGTQPTVPNNPAQYSVPGMGNTDVMGAYGDAYKGQLGAYNSAVASDNATMQTGASLASTLAMLYVLSDRRLKTNIRSTGKKSPRGYTLYSYDLFGVYPTEGVMAQEVQAVDPSAVVELATGFLAVDYSKV